MTRLVTATSAVDLDEWCWSLSELHQPAADFKSLRRIQTIKVIRGVPPPVEFQRDLGRADQFTAGEFAIPGGVWDPTTGRYELLHTVGELYDMAERIRTRYNYEPPDPPKPTDLIGLYFDQPDKDRRKRKALSQFGPAARIQRS